jgi:hypothetical protein
MAQPLAKATNRARRPRRLSFDYHAKKKKKKTPHFEQLVGSVTFQQLKEEPVSGPTTIRLFFHGFSVEVN